MKLFRQSIFETNSSSTHSIVMCMGSDIEKWKKGELLFLKDEKRFLSVDELDKYYREQYIKYNAKFTWVKDGQSYYTYKDIQYKELEDMLTEEYLNEITKEQLQKFIDEDLEYYDMPLDYDKYWDSVSEEYEGYEESMTTPSGEEVVAFGYYGMD